MTNEKNILLVGSIFVFVLLFCYLIFRKYYSNYELKNDLKKLNNHLSLMAIILAFFSIMFIINVSIKTEIEFISNGYDIIKYEAWIFSYFYNLDQGYTFRGISIGLLVFSITGLVVSVKYKKATFILISTIIGIISSILSNFDVEKNQYFVSVYSILSLVILFIIIILLFINEKIYKTDN